ncbi:MAG: antibiotic biosynthesis monooxygenase [Polyangiaceae bacterium]|nr:antibiotic biosynthesis monooxygenase [Polyangiaceae bacterium]
MFVVCVTVHVKPGAEARFLEATRANHDGTRAEPGNVRFDVLQHVDTASQFFLYEVYRSPEAFSAHQKTPHYLAWREAVAELMEKPRQGVKHVSVFPSDADF